MMATPGVEARQAQLDRLLMAALPHVAFDGWTRTAFVAGARDLGLPADEVSLSFRYLPDDALAHFSDWADRRMLVSLEEDAAFAEGRVRDKIYQGVRTRLELFTHHKEALRRSAAILALPSRGPLAGRLLWQSSDRLWRLAGDTATDFNHYSKRALLSGIFASTTLYYLSDTSADHHKTWNFLERRIETVLQLGRRIGRLAGMGQRLCDGCRRPSAAAP